MLMMILAGHDVCTVRNRRYLRLYLLLLLERFASGGPDGVICSVLSRSGSLAPLYLVLREVVNLRQRKIG